jgi:hypothetical protein
LKHINNVLENKRKRIEAGEELFVDYEKGQTFNEDEDTYLANHLLKSGYSGWEDLRFKFKSQEEFRFNFLMQTRTDEEIQSRCDFLSVAMEKSIDSTRKIRKLKDDPDSLVEVSSDLKWFITFPKIHLS